jgi:hypothetical protein
MSEETAGQQRLIANVRATQDRWRRLVSDVPRERMEQPGAMGDWTFKDVALHLTGWRRRTIRRLEAAAAGEPEPPNPWPDDLGDDEDDTINAWMHERTKDRPLDEALAEADAIWDEFAAVVATLPEDLLTDPTRFDWMEGVALADGDFAAHLDEHEPGVRAWLARA